MYFKGEHHIDNSDDKNFIKEVDTIESAVVYKSPFIGNSKGFWG